MLMTRESSSSSVTRPPLTASNSLCPRLMGKGISRSRPARIGSMVECTANQSDMVAPLYPHVSRRISVTSVLFSLQNDPSTLLYANIMATGSDTLRRCCQAAR